MVNKGWQCNHQVFGYNGRDLLFGFIALFLEHRSILIVMHRATVR